MFSTNYKTC